MQRNDIRHTRIQREREEIWVQILSEKRCGMCVLSLAHVLIWQIFGQNPVKIITQDRCSRWNFNVSTYQTPNVHKQPLNEMFIKERKKMRSNRIGCFNRRRRTLPLNFYLSFFCLFFIQLSLELSKINNFKMKTRSPRKVDKISERKKKKKKCPAQLSSLMHFTSLRIEARSHKNSWIYI